MEEVQCWLICSPRDVVEAQEVALVLGARLVSVRADMHHSPHGVRLVGYSTRQDNVTKLLAGYLEAAIYFRMVRGDWDTNPVEFISSTGSAHPITGFLPQEDTGEVIAVLVG